MAKNPFAAYNKSKGDKAYGGKETLEEEEAEHGVKLDAPLKTHKGKETPAEEVAEELEIAELTGEEPEVDEYIEEAAGEMSPQMFVDEVKALLAELDTPTAKRPKQWSMNETKLPL